jgi:TonB-linked SusC/RagA family outer membrane protein
MRKSSLPWRYALTGLVAITLMAPVAASAAPTSSEAPQTSAANQKRTVTGTVVDIVDGEPLPGATVTVRGDKNNVTATDIDGNFSITVPNNKAVLVITYVGYQEAVVPVENEAYVNVQMKGDDKTLDEVVVVGAGTQKRVSVTGAITSVKGDDLRMPSTTLTSALAGKIAGVVAMTNSGEPGSGATFYIRGISSFGGGNTPLILLDDVEISVGDLNYIPAENIESFSILKDASATAIYGARGANGVMIVKTKGGDYNSQTRISVSLENSFNFLDDFPSFVDGADYMTMHNIARTSRGDVTQYSQTTIDRTRSGLNQYLYPNVDWADVLFKDMSMRQRANINVSGGGSKVKYYMSLDFQHEDGVIKTDKIYSWNNNINIYNYTFQNNISYKLTPTTTISVNMNAQIRQKSSPTTSSTTLFNYTLTTTPIAFPVSYPSIDGDDFVRYGSKKYSEHVLTNPYADMATGYSETGENTINTVVKINQELDMITKGLKLEAWVNFKSWSERYFTRTVTPYYYTISKPDNYVDEDGNVTTDFQDSSIYTRLQEGTVYMTESGPTAYSDQTFEFQANLQWNRTFNSVHNLGAMVRYSMRDYRSSSSILPNRNQGISGRLTYDYAHRYLAEFNIGYNGTERLAKGKRFGTFPAGSIGWVVSNEEFFQPISNIITNFKIRASYGLVGSDDLASVNGSYFLYMDKITNNTVSYMGYTTGDYETGTQSFYGPQMLYYANTNVVWEKSKKADLGIDLSLFGDLSIVADIYQEKRYDIFMARGLWPYSLGYGSAVPYGNIGRMKSQGLELSLDYSKRINSDWSVSARGTFTYAENKYEYYDEALNPYSWMNTTGLPYSIMRGYIAEGLFTSQEEIDNSPTQQLGSNPQVGDIKYRDLNGDGYINEQDRTMISENGTVPRIQYGFGGTVNWKNWDFGFQFTGSAKRNIFMGDIHPFQEGGTNADARNVLVWISENYFDPEKENFDALYPRLGTYSNDVANNTVNSTYWMRNGSFLRLRQVELGWSFPYGRVYLCGNNLLTFSPFSLWDPELSSWNTYPMQKSVTIGVKLTI